MATKSENRRIALTAAIADVLLRDRVAVVPLRDLAEQLGTSDRMLLYYFGTQAALTAAALSHLSALLTARLENTVPATRRKPGTLLRLLSHAMADPAIAPILRVWADVAARGARGEAPFDAFSQASIVSWRNWIAQRLDVSGAARRDRTAAALLVVIEGARMLELNAPGMADAALPLLAQALD